MQNKIHDYKMEYLLLMDKWKDKKYNINPATIVIEYTSDRTRMKFLAQELDHLTCNRTQNE